MLSLPTIEDQVTKFIQNLGIKDKLSQNTLEDGVKAVILASDKFNLLKVIEDGIFAVIKASRTLDFYTLAFLKEVSLVSNPEKKSRVFFKI